MKIFTKELVKENLLYNKHAGIFTLVILVLLSSLSYCQDNGVHDPYLISRSEPLTITLTYKETDEDQEAEDSYGRDTTSGATESKRYGAEGIVGHIERIPKKISDSMRGTPSGSSSETKGTKSTSKGEPVSGDLDKALKATLTVNITPELRRNSLVIDSLSAEITVNSHKVQTFKKLDEKIIKELKLEAEDFVTALEKWYKRLSSEEKKKLRSGNKLLVDVNKPYQKLKKFKGDKLKVPVNWKTREVKERVDINFVQRYNDGFLEIYRIPRGEPFWVEAKFYETPKEEEKDITMSWAGSEIKVKVKRTDDMSTLYRSLPFVVNPLNKKSEDKTQ
jgi:hypothetical protein